MSDENMIRGLSRRLEAACAQGTLIRLSRHYESGWINAYVIGVGRDWFLIAVVSDGMFPEGYMALRRRDVTVFHDPTPYRDFVEAALDKRSIRRPTSLAIDLSDAASVVISVSRLYPLVTIHREDDDAEVCQIGRVVACTKRSITLHEIEPGAVWEDEPSSYRLSEITRIDFGGPYEDALALVGLMKTGRSRRVVQAW